MILTRMECTQNGQVFTLDMYFCIDTKYFNTIHIAVLREQEFKFNFQFASVSHHFNLYRFLISLQFASIGFLIISICIDSSS
jgi:hypothetical protein